MTIEGWDEDDTCRGDCCTETGRRPDRPASTHRVQPLTPLPTRTRLRLAVHGRRTPRQGGAT